MPSSALITIQYTIPGSKLTEYRALASRLVEKINGMNSGVNLAVYASDNDPGKITEVFECDDSEHYEGLEDAMDEETRTIVRRVATEFAVGRETFTSHKRLY